MWQVASVIVGKKNEQIKKNLDRELNVSKATHWKKKIT